MPKVSVIVPVHNAAKYVEKCVESILGQTLKDIEIILVENASTDNSLAVCQMLAETNERVKVIHSDIGDPSVARNLGIEASSGSYLGFVDSDDTIDIEMYSTLLDIIEKEDLDIVFCDFVKKYDYRSDRYPFENSGKITVASAQEILKLNFKDKIPQSQCTLLCRRELFANVNFPEGRYYEDTATTWKLLLRAKRAGHIARPFYHYYRHPGSIVHTSSFKIHYGHIVADVERIDYINASKDFSEQEKLELGIKPLEGFYRHFRKMVLLAKSKEEKEICLKCREWVIGLPGDYKLRRKFARMRNLLENHWRVFCLLNRLRLC